MAHSKQVGNKLKFILLRDKLRLFAEENLVFVLVGEPPSHVRYEHTVS